MATKQRLDRVVNEQPRAVLRDRLYEVHPDVIREREKLRPGATEWLRDLHKRQIEHGWRKRDQETPAETDNASDSTGDATSQQHPDD